LHHPVSQPLLNLSVQPAYGTGSDPDAARKSIGSLKLVDHGSAQSGDLNYLRQSKNLQVRIGQRGSAVHERPIRNLRFRSL